MPFAPLVAWRLLLFLVGLIKGRVAPSKPNMEPSFEVKVRSHAIPGGPPRGETVVTLTAPMDDKRTVRLRLRPAWRRDSVGATLMAKLSDDDALWDCARYMEQEEVHHLGDDWFSARYAKELYLTPEEHALSLDQLHAHCLRQNKLQGGYRPVPANVTWSSSLDGFWAYLADRRNTSVALKEFRVMGFEHKACARAVLELYAVVRLSAGFPQPYQPESDQHFSMRLELVRVE